MWVANSKILFFHGWKIFLCVHILYPHFHRWTLRLLPCLQGILGCQYPFELALCFLQRNIQKWRCCHRELGPGAWPRRVKTGHWWLRWASPFTLRCCQGPWRGKTHEERGKNYFVLFCIWQACMEQPLKAGTNFGGWEHRGDSLPFTCQCDNR